jgi:hypothetical protein
MMWSLLARSRFSRQVLVTAVGTLACALILNVKPAEAQLSLLNGVSAAPTAFVATAAAHGLLDGVDAAYDPGNNVYLVVGGKTYVTGVFVNASGTPVTSPIAIRPQGTDDRGVGAMPHVKYSPELGGFLVAWASEDNPDRLHVRTIKYPGVLGPETVVTDSTAFLTIGGIAVGYSPSLQVFLVVYKTAPAPSSPSRLRAQLFNLNGAKISGSVQISDTFGDFPSIAWNPVDQAFGVSYSGEDQSHVNDFFSVFVRIPASNPGTFSRTRFNTSATGRTAATSIEYNPSTGNYVMVWQEPQHAKVAEISASGTVLTMGTASTVVGRNSYDALSAALNPTSGTFLLVGLMGSGDDVGGAELNAHGVRTSSSDTGVLLSKSPVSPAEPARYTLVRTNTEAPHWITVFKRMSAVMTQEVATSTTGGGGTAKFAAYTAGSTSGSGGTSTGSGGTSTPPPSGPSCAGASKPVSSWVCVSDSMGTGWLPPDNPRTIQFLQGGTPPPSNPPPQETQAPSTPPPTTSCTSSKPVSSWVCVNGGWLPPDHPLALAYLKTHTTSTQGSTTPPPTNPYAPCVTPPPGTGWVCTAQGNWLPPDNPNAIPALPTCSSSYGNPPVAGWVRVGDGWLPPDHPGALNAICKAR